MESPQPHDDPNDKLYVSRLAAGRLSDDTAVIEAVKRERERERRRGGRERSGGELVLNPE